MNWITYFADFFRQSSEQLHVVLDAGGCREGWVQGEMFRYARKCHLDLETNTTRFKFDLLCEAPPMIAELKICGGNYQRKMMGRVEADLKKLADAEGVGQRFLILIVDNRHPDTDIGRWLTTWTFPHTQAQEIRLSESVVVRMWEITSGAQQRSAYKSSKAADGLT